MIMDAFLLTMFNNCAFIKGFLFFLLLCCHINLLIYIGAGSREEAGAESGAGAGAGAGSGAGMKNLYEG